MVHRSSTEIFRSSLERAGGRRQGAGLGGHIRDLPSSMCGKVGPGLVDGWAAPHAKPYPRVGIPSQVRPYPLVGQARPRNKNQVGNNNITYLPGYTGTMICSGAPSKRYIAKNNRMKNSRPPKNSLSMNYLLLGVVGGWVWEGVTPPSRGYFRLTSLVKMFRTC